MWPSRRLDDNDLWQRAQIGICTVGNDRRFVNSSLDKIIDFIEKMYLAEVIEKEMEIITVLKSWMESTGDRTERWKENDPKELLI